MDDNLGKSRPFNGSVHGYDLLYDDGDAEELSEGEVEKILLRGDKKKKSHKKQRSSSSNKPKDVALLKWDAFVLGNGWSATSRPPWRMDVRRLLSSTFSSRS